MHLYQNEVMSIELKEDVLWVSWQERASLEDFKPVADTIAAYGRQAQTSKMLIDARFTPFRKLTPDKGIMDYFVQVIGPTPINRIARIMSENAVFESKVLFQKLYYDTALQLPFNYQFFSDEAEALAWLRAEDMPA